MRKSLKKWLHPKKIPQRKLFTGNRCALCGKEIDFDYRYSKETYAYKTVERNKKTGKYKSYFYCSWNHMRAIE